MKKLQTPTIAAVFCIGLAGYLYLSLRTDEPLKKSSALDADNRQTTLKSPNASLTSRPAPSTTHRPTLRTQKALTQSAPQETESPLALKVCQSEILSQFSDPSLPCAAQVNGLKDVLEKRVEELQKTGVALNSETCVATDPNGETSDLDSILSDLAELTKWLITQKLLSFGPEFKTYRHRRVHLVAACSVLKTIAYWGKFPGEIPAPENIQYYLHFDMHAGKPRESQITGSLVTAFAFAERTKREIEKLN